MSDIVITEWGRVEDRIRKLEAQVAALTAERDRYRAALEQYADRENWHMLTFNPGRETNWIGGGEGPDVAEKALAGESESEAK